MLGTRIYKSEFDEIAYKEAALWANNNNAVIKDFAEYYEVVAIPDLSLQELKDKKLLIISDWTEQHITGGFVYNNVTYDSDIDTQITMQGIALNVHTEQFATEYPEGCPVRGYDAGSSEKTIHMLSADEVMGFCAALSMHIGTCKQIGWILQNQVEAATTPEELDQIVWIES